HTRDVTASRQAQEQLRAETEFTNHIIDSLPGLFYAVDMQGNIVRTNRTFLSTLGYTHDALQDLDPFGLFVAEDRQQVRAALSQVFEEGSARLEASFRTADGGSVRYSLTGTRVETPNGPLMVGTGLDISQQLEAQRRIE